MRERNPFRFDQADRERRLWRVYRKAAERAMRFALQPGDHDDEHKIARSRRAEARLVVCRNKLAENYLPLVHRAAQKLAHRVPNCVQVEDLVSEGLFGLMHAIADYEPETAGGTRFTTYAPYRIVSAMRDYLRSLDESPRLMRHRARKVAHTREQYFQQHGRQPTDEEVGQLLGLDDDALQRWLRDARMPQMSSLHAPARSQHDGERPSDHATLFPDTKAPDPSREVMRRSVREHLLRRFSRAERLIVVLYYTERMSMREIGVTLSLSESRVSQMMSSIRQRLKVMTHGDDNHLAASA